MYVHVQAVSANGCLVQFSLGGGGGGRKAVLRIRAYVRRYTLAIVKAYTHSSVTYIIIMLILHCMYM